MSPLCKLPRAFEEALVIQENEWLEGGVGGEAAGLADFAAAGIEREQSGRRSGAFTESVKTAAVEAVAFVRLVIPAGGAGFRPDAGGLPGFDTGAAGFFHQQPGSEKRMPVILGEGAYDAWLNVAHPEKAREFMRPYAANWLTANPVEGKQLVQLDRSLA